MRRQLVTMSPFSSPASVRSCTAVAATPTSRLSSSPSHHQQHRPQQHRTQQQQQQRQQRSRGDEVTVASSEAAASDGASDASNASLDEGNRAVVSFLDEPIAARDPVSPSPALINEVGGCTS
jgi:hypothetical protein